MLDLMQQELDFSPGEALTLAKTIRPPMSSVDPLLQRLRHLYVTPISELKPRSVLAG
jgi:hypothetical protein